MSRIVRPETAKSFERVYAEGYDKQYPSVDLVRLESWFFQRKLGRVLDYGCGPGTNGLHLLDLGYEVTFADVAREALKKVETKLAKRETAVRQRATVRAIDLDADTLPYADGSHAYIICMSVLGNLEGQENVRRLLREFHRVLAPRGKIIVDINTKDTTYIDLAQKKLGKGVYETLPHKGFQGDPILMYFPESAEEFVQLIQSCGFIVDDVGHSSFAYHGNRDFEIIVCGHTEDSKHK
jgi:SAM-dependent methyltransferase